MADKQGCKGTFLNDATNTFPKYTINYMQPTIVHVNKTRPVT